MSTNDFDEYTEMMKTLRAIHKKHPHVIASFMDIQALNLTDQERNTPLTVEQLEGIIKVSEEGHMEFMATLAGYLEEAKNTKKQA